MITCLLDTSTIITNSLRSDSVIIMDYAVRTSPSTSANSCRKLMTGYLFIAVYTDVNGYSGEWLYHYLTFFINFICFLLFQQWFCLARSNVFITRTYVFYTHRFHNTYPHLHKTIFIGIPFSSTTSHISCTSSSPFTALLLLFILFTSPICIFCL